MAALIAQDAALESEFQQIGAVEKLVLFQRDLVRLLNNYVSFAEFYGRRGSIFQAGSLFLDARTCHLCIEVLDAGKHAALAGLSGAYLAYCEVARPGLPKKTIVAVFTDGDSDNLMVGRNGVFYDRKGQDWDATIIRIVANPISVREAFWSPYKKFVRLVEDQIAKRAAAADAESQAKIGSAATAVAQADKAKADAKAPPQKLDLGTIALIGTAIGGISAMVGALLDKLLGLGPWLPLGLLGLVFLISGPAMLLAYMKLRQRNLAPILDANGWAINTKAKMNVPFGAALTHVAKLPANAERSLEDPYAEKASPWRTRLVLLAIVVLGYCWTIEKLDAYLPGPMKYRSLYPEKAAR
jgi:F0F1-type ATP synthase assembly protein I